MKREAKSPKPPRAKPAFCPHPERISLAGIPSEMEKLADSWRGRR